MSCDAKHPFGLVCKMDGPHGVHAAQGDSGDWTYWSDAPLVPPSRKQARPSNAEMMGVVHTLENTPPERLVRGTDPSTSAEGAKHIRSGTHKYRMLVAYSRADDGLTPNEAVLAADLNPWTGAWHRATDLRNDGLIADTGRKRVFKPTGEEGIVYVITPAGIAALGVVSPS